jgi:hypothetical protein
MGKIEQLAPSKRVRIVLCAGALAVAAVVPSAGFAADWSSGIKAPTADWSSAVKRPTADWSSSVKRPAADWSSSKRAPKADWSSSFKASSLR